MTLTLQAEKAPIKTNADGAALVGNTRVRLETIISAFHRGDSPEQIVDSFDVLSLADVYAVIAYYLNHREEVDEYIHQQDLAAEEVYRKIEANRPEMFSLRTRLIERKAKRV
ncbi:MAG: DUF433 domain-containing protein [Bacteroidetes bacterium]|nr:MAG: DUF433 domain-containing protein [Bacteroidota bacterium]